jgi:hypothetical protein
MALKFYSAIINRVPLIDIPISSTLSSELIEARKGFTAVFSHWTIHFFQQILLYVCSIKLN